MGRFSSKIAALLVFLTNILIITGLSVLVACIFLDYKDSFLYNCSLVDILGHIITFSFCKNLVNNLY